MPQNKARLAAGSFGEGNSKSFGNDIWIKNTHSCFRSSYTGSSFHSSS
jgi:hypothetical protein